MIEVPNITEGDHRYRSICGCFAKGAFAISVKNPNLVSAHKYGILFWLLDAEYANEVSNRSEVFDDPEFAYWMLRVGIAVETERNYAIIENLRLFTSWLFVRINQ